ncbi:MAG: hypothetical protein ACD_13C00280G0001 [uncultured bacterium]|nr:MAG: hypothetical protein ACD_13C00280G0001 [uncultured bacterium]
MPKSIYTVKEVAGLLGFSTNTVYKYLEEGSIKSVRLGSEGRFRIPASEVERLLQEKGRKRVGIAKSLPANSNFPSIFDWFVGFMSIGIGFSQFIKPMYATTLNAMAGIAPIINIICILLIIGGILLLGFDMFDMRKGERRMFFNASMGLLYLVLAGIFASQASVVATGYLALSLVFIFAAFKKEDGYLHYLVFINILCILIGLATAVWPDSFGVFALSKYVSISKNVYSLFWILFFYFLLFSSYKAYRGNRIFIWVTNLTVGLLSCFYAIVAFANGYWGSSVFGVVLGTFSFIFPIREDFHFFETKNRKETIIGFFWLLGAFIAGSMILRMAHNSFQNSILTRMGREVETASAITGNFVDNGVSILETSLAIGNYKNLLQSEINKENLDKELKETFLLSDGAFRRVVVTNSDGEIVDTYPYYSQSQNVNISDRDYFTVPADKRTSFVTGIVVPKTPGIGPSILISLPILNDDDKFLGIILADINILELQKHLGEVGLDKKESLSVVDSQGNYILNTGIKGNKQIIYAEDLDTTPGNTKLAIGYNDDGVLEFAASRGVGEYGWTVLTNEPQSAAMRTYAMMGLGIFLFFILFTIGSMVFVIFLKKDADQI